MLKNDRRSTQKIVVSVGLSLVISSAGYANSFVVAPVGTFDQEGDRRGSPGVIPPSRSQSLYLASDFDSLPEGQNVIVGFAVRPDQRQVSESSVTWESLRITLSAIPDDHLSSVFDENLSANATVVHEGEFASTMFAYHDVNDFNAGIDLAMPFCYQPS